MAKIRDANTLISMLDGGELAGDLSTEITETLAALEANRAGRKKTKVTGSVTLKIKFTNDSSGSTIDVELDSKRPKKLRESTFLFVTEDGTLLNENPKQADMFGPRDIAPRASA
jgi:aminoglycoside phosphotransferase family enzyme